MTRKILALALAVVMVVGLFAGCNTNSGNSTTAAGTTAAATTKAAGTTAAGTTAAATTAAPESNLNDLGVLPLVKEPVTMTVGISDADGFRLGADHPEAIWLEEQTGVDLEFEIFPKGEYGTKIELMIAAGGEDLPNMLWGLSLAGTGSTAQYNWGNEGFLVDIAPLMADNTYFSPAWIAEDTVDMTWDKLMDMSTNIDGTMYYFPSWLESFRGTSLYASYDWLTAAGYSADENGEYIKTMDDFISYLEWVRDTDPNGNGEKDEIPLIGYNGSDLRKTLYSAFLGQSGGYGSFAYIDGEVMCSSARPEFQDLLILVNKLVKDKLLDPLTFTQDSTSLSTIATTDPNIVGANFALNWRNATQVTEGEPGVIVRDDGIAIREDLNTSQKYPGVPIDGLQVEGYERGVRAFIGWAECNFSVTMTCEDPALAVRFGDFMGGKEASLFSSLGEEGKSWDYVKNVDWEKIGTDKEKVTAQTGLYDLEDCIYGYSSLEMEANGNTYAEGTLWIDKCFGFNGVYNSHNGLAMRRAYNMTNASALQENIWKLQAYHQNTDIFPTDEVISGVKYTEEEMEVRSDIWAPINTYIGECFTRFAMGDLDPVADWDAYIDELYAMGLQEVLDSENTAYARTFGK